MMESRLKRCYFFFSFKQGSRSSSSACGSADVLEAMGVVIDLEPEVGALNFNNRTLKSSFELISGFATSSLEGSITVRFCFLNSFSFENSAL